LLFENPSKRRAGRFAYDDSDPTNARTREHFRKRFRDVHFGIRVFSIEAERHGLRASHENGRIKPRGRSGARAMRTEKNASTLVDAHVRIQKGVDSLHGSFQRIALFMVSLAKDSSTHSRKTARPPPSPNTGRLDANRMVMNYVIADDHAMKRWCRSDIVRHTFDDARFCSSPMKYPSFLGVFTDQVQSLSL